MSTIYFIIEFNARILSKCNFSFSDFPIFMTIITRLRIFFPKKCNFQVICQKGASKKMDNSLHRLIYKYDPPKNILG